MDELPLELIDILEKLNLRIGHTVHCKGLNDKCTCNYDEVERALDATRLTRTFLG